MQTPVIFMVFNRPAVTERVLRRIRERRPGRMTVICDGPRADVPTDAGRVAAVRALIDRLVDWPCQLTRDYAETNLRCGPRIASGLEAAFRRYDRAIVLEDDTLPEPTFFDFCESMLDRYEQDPAVVHISGTNAAVGTGAVPREGGCRFSRLPDIWGWATWADSFAHYDFGMREWETVRRTRWMASVTPSGYARKNLRGAFKQQHRLVRNPHTWDTAWVYSCMRRGLSITPGVNLVTNLGYGSDGTNCRHDADPLAEMPTAPIDVERLTESPREIDPRFERELFAARYGDDSHKKKRTLAQRLRIDLAARTIGQALGLPTEGRRSAA